MSQNQNFKPRYLAKYAIFWREITDMSSRAFSIFWHTIRTYLTTFPKVGRPLQLASFGHGSTISTHRSIYEYVNITNRSYHNHSVVNLPLWAVGRLDRHLWRLCDGGAFMRRYETRWSMVVLVFWQRETETAPEIRTSSTETNYLG